MFTRILSVIDFYSFVLSHMDQLTVLSFDEITQDTGNSITKITEATGIELVYDDLEKLKEKVFFAIEDWTRKYSTRERLALPTGQRELWKYRIMKDIRRCKHFSKARDVFDDILNAIMS